MNALLNTNEFNEFCSKVDILNSKGYNTFSFTVDRTKEGMYNVEILGEHDVAQLDTLTES